MARKVYSEEDREKVRKALINTMIQCIVDRGLIHSSIDVLCKRVGISKTFFYTFFSSKEELVLEALRYQQPRLLDYAHQLMEDPALSWREGVETFKVSMPFDRIRSVFMENCFLSLVFLRMALTLDYSAIWLWS